MHVILDADDFPDALVAYDPISDMDVVCNHELGVERDSTLVEFNRNVQNLTKSANGQRFVECEFPVHWSNPFVGLFEDVLPAGVELPAGTFDDVVALVKP